MGARTRMSLQYAWRRLARVGDRLIVVGGVRGVPEAKPAALLQVLGIFVALVALLLALSGSATAALVMTGSSIKDGTITGKDLANRTLGSKKLSKRAISALAGKPGPQGPAGPRGAEGSSGADGLQGPPGPVKLVHKDGTNDHIAAGDTAGFAVGCPASASNVVGGGYDVGPGTPNFRVLHAEPADGGDPDGIPDDNWDVMVHNAGATPVTLTTYAICRPARSSRSSRASARRSPAPYPRSGATCCATPTSTSRTSRP
jgi:hypothetical protein